MKRFFPRQLWLYLIREFLLWFLGGLVVITALIFLLEFSELLRRTHGTHTLGYGILLEMALLKIPHMIEELLPFLIFFSSMLCLWRLNRNRELLVIRAVGVSVWQFLSPLAVASLCIGLLDLGVFNAVACLMKQRYDYLDTKYLFQKEYSLKIAESGIWIYHVRPQESMVFRVGRVEEATNTFHDLTLYRYDATHSFKERVDAPLGVFKHNALHIPQAWVVAGGELPHQVHALSIPCDLSFAKLLETTTSPDSMSFWELSHFIYLLEKSGLLKADYRLYWHASVSKIFWLMAMVFLAASCVMHGGHQRKKGRFMIFGVFSGFGLYVLKDVTYVMGAASGIPIMLAAWTPALITFMAGASVLLFLEDG